MRVAELLNTSDWFTLDAEYPVLKESLQAPFLNLYADILLGYHFNRPTEVVPKIKELITHYQEEIGFDNVCGMVRLVSILEQQLGNYAQAADNLSNFMTQLKQQGVEIDYSSYERMYNNSQVWREYAAPAVSRPDANVEIPVTIAPVQLLVPLDGKKTRGLDIRLPVTIHGVSYPFVFDTGAGMTYMSERFAKEVGVKIVNDSLLMNGGMLGAGYGMEGYLDSLQIGDIVFRNARIFIARPNAVDSIAVVDAVLGLDFIRRIDEIRIDIRNKKLIFPQTTTPLPVTGRNLLLKDGNSPVLKAQAGDDRLLFVFDTGCVTADLYYSFYQKYQAEIDRVATRESVTGGGYGYVRTKEMLKMPSVRFCIGDVAVEMKDIRVHPDEGNDQSPEDGNLGMDLVKLFDKTIINFKDMFVKFE